MTTSFRRAPGSIDVAAPVRDRSVDEHVPDYFHSVRWLRRVRIHFSLRARRRFYDDFIKWCAPTDAERVIDVGVTPVRSIVTANFFERWYPYRNRVTATSIEDASFLEQQYPGMKFVRTDGRTLPFEDESFDIVFSSAVVEHVGDAADQQLFISELVRVGKRFFVITPNRWHPLEFHTLLPLLHWLPRRAHQALLRVLGHHEWATTDNLNLVSAKRFRALFPAGAVVTVRRRRLAGFTSHLIAFGHAPGDGGAEPR